MNSTAVNNPATLFQTTTPNAAKQNSAATSDAGSFDQVLSREMSANNGSKAPTPAANANNNANNNVNSSANNNNNNNVNASNDTKAAQKDNDNGDSTKNDTSSNTQDTTTAEAGKKADDDKVTSGKDVKKDDKDSDEAGIATNQAGIAAFVAALTSAKAAAPADAAAAAVATAVSTAPAGKVLTDADIKTKNDTADIVAKLGNSDTATGDKDAIGKKSDFVSALDKATANASDNAKAATPAVKTEADVAAAAASQTIKVLDTAVASTPQTFAAVAAAAIQPRNDAPSVTSNTLTPEVGSQDWNNALGQKVVWMVKGAEQTATLTLNPPDLGPMQVTVNVNNNQATASFTAHQPEVRHALEASMPRLREMLNEAGIQLGQSSVSGGTPNQQGGFDQAQQGSNSGRRAQSANAIESTVHVSHVPTPAGGSGMVDTFA